MVTSTATSAVQPIAELFTTSVSALWATTYNIDLALFNEFLLPRLGDPPLNVVVLSDDRRLAASLERVPIERVDTLASVNCRWLLRGARLGGQAFHPKSYLAMSRTRATLLVGSGNLSFEGLDEGREVFTVFRSGTTFGDSAIAAWRSWMLRLVEALADITLADRFRDLEDRLAPMLQTEQAVLSPLLHNLDQPIADQLAARVLGEVNGSVDELLLAAPFYDGNAEAVGRLITGLKPHRVSVYVTSRTSVDGAHLIERLDVSGADVNIFVYEPDRFVHAKLVGVIAGHHGWLLSGSPNLSRAALTRAIRDGGNVELAVLAYMDPNQVRATFVPPGMTTSIRSLEALASLRLAPDDDPGTPDVRLIAAARTVEGRVALRSEPHSRDGWLLDDLSERQPIKVEVEPPGRAVTVGPLRGRLVRLVDTDGKVTANAATSTSDKPPGLAVGDLETPLGQALQWLHRNLVMDVSERITKAPSGGVAAGEADEQADDSLWERLEREELARDPRAGTYRRMWSRTLLSGGEPIIDLLEVLRTRTPADTKSGSVKQSWLASLLDRQEPPEEKSEQLTRRWKLSARIRVRARNVLRRWAAAQTDPRLVWVDPLAPAGNFAVIAAFLAGLRRLQIQNPQTIELTGDDLDDLWFRWLRTFVGSGQGDGWLDRLDSATLEHAQERLPEGIPEVAAALCWFAVNPGNNYRERVVQWQPVLCAALNHKLLDPTPVTARYLTEVTGTTISKSQVDGQLLGAIEFIDDALWCERTIAELDLGGLELKGSPGAKHVQIRLDVRGIPDPLLDPRVPRLIVSVRHYRQCDGVALWAADDEWRLVVVTGTRIYVRRDGTAIPSEPIQSLEPVRRGLLEKLAGTGGVLAALFPRA